MTLTAPNIRPIDTAYFGDLETPVSPSKCTRFNNQMGTSDSIYGTRRYNVTVVEGWFPGNKLQGEPPSLLEGGVAKCLSEPGGGMCMRGVRESGAALSFAMIMGLRMAIRGVGEWQGGTRQKPKRGESFGCPCVHGSYQH